MTGYIDRTRRASRLLTTEAVRSELKTPEAVVPSGTMDIDGARERGPPAAPSRYHFLWHMGRPLVRRIHRRLAPGC